MAMAGATAATSAPLPRTPVVLAEAVDDRDAVSRLIDRHQPYWPVQRYFANSAEYAALSGQAERLR
jgi:hypothetical protein